MTITYQQFQPLADSAFSFTAILDGIPYNVVVTWNIYGQRWYINIYTTQGALIYATPLIESPDGYDISMVDGLFNDSLVFRDSSQQFEMNDAPVAIVPGTYFAPQDYMLDAAGNKFMLDSSLLGAGIPGQLFDALGNPFILNQSALSGDVMLDASGQQFILGPSNQLNPGMVTAYFSIAPVVGAIITALDANGVEYPMGIGDAVQTNFATSAADTLALPAKIYKQDWQGKQLQYSTARTNSALQSENWSFYPPWNNNNITVTPNAINGPDGRMVMTKLESTGTSGFQYQSINIIGNSNTAFSAIFMAGTANQAILDVPFLGVNYSEGFVGFDLANGVVISNTLPSQLLNMSIVSIGGGFYEISGVLRDVGNNTSLQIRFLPKLNGEFVSGTFIYGGYLNVALNSSVIGSYIPTTTAPVTVTDYTENIGGGVLAATQDLSSQQMLGADGQPLTLDGSQI